LIKFVTFNNIYGTVDLQLVQNVLMGIH